MVFELYAKLDAEGRKVKLESIPPPEDARKGDKRVEVCSADVCRVGKIVDLWEGGLNREGSLIFDFFWEERTKPISFG